MDKTRSDVIEEDDCEKFHIVGVGASAGGLEALETFFHAMPADSGMAFVVIQHLSPDFKSHMEELLGRQTSMPIYRVENGLRVEPNSIYLIPAKMEMIISKGKLLLTERSTDRALIHPIDQFLRSLAVDCGPCGVAVILSGTGSDGSRGVIEVSSAGGLVLVQDDASAKFDGMPMSASATGKVDLVLPPEAMADVLVRYARDGLSKQQLLEENLALSGLDGVDKVAMLLNRRYGIDFSQYKVGTVGRRINRRLELQGLDSIDSYVAKLANDDTELSLLYEDLLIGVTKFFRDPEAFEALQREVIAPLVKNPETKSIRIWVSACASGEEAYSIAMLVDEELRKASREIEVKIFATDAHGGSLQTAAKGVYPEGALEELDEERRQRYFTRGNDGYHVNRELRSTVIFAAHNLINDAPFTQMDLVTCRNMLIYLQPSVQNKALGMFHFALKANGALFLGPSESAGGLSDEFKAIDGRWRIFAKRRDVRLPLAARAPMGKRIERLPYAPLKPQSRSNRVDQDVIDTYDQLLSKVMPSSILVSESGDILHVFGGAERYLKTRKGRPSNHLLESIDESIRAPISIAWHHSIKKEERVRAEPTIFDGPNGEEEVKIGVLPLMEGNSGPNNFLIEILSTGEQVNNASPPVTADREMHQTRIEGLESELRFSQENLQAALEEMESSNEELQASNQELLAANEELQSTNEELHSVNEELYTVNAEHQRRVQELAVANDDMDNLLATTRVGVIFLDSDLYIRRFTPAIAKVFNFTGQDKGRSIETFASVLNCDDLNFRLKKVIESGEELEIKVTDRGETHYLLRATPYRSGDNTGGIVLTLIDISNLVDAEAEIHLQKMAIESAINGIVISDPSKKDNPIIYANQGFLKLTGYDLDEVLGRNCRFLQGDDMPLDQKTKIRSAVDQGLPVRTVIPNRRKDGTTFWNDISITPIRNVDGKLTNFVGVQHDVTVQVDSQAKLKEANRTIQEASDAKSTFLATISHELRTPLTAVLGFADILRSELSDPGYQSKLDVIVRNGQYLLALVNDILDLSKIESGKFHFENGGFNIRSLLEETEIMMKGRAQEAGIPLRFDLSSPLPMIINADGIRVRQILVNLISNALKFTDEGEVVVKAGVAQEMANNEKNHWLEISVSDTGIGISKSQQEKLFTPFTQVSNETSKHAGGTGLGLSISKRLAEGMGGHIKFESELGDGSKFTLCLPLSSHQAAIESLDAFSSNHSSSSQVMSFPTINGKILIADDRRDIWQVGKFFLEKCGATVSIAENGLQAVQLVKQASEEESPFALILMDMQMPVMNGKEAIKRIREMGFDSPIIALTADAMDGERESCIAMGCDEYFPKPINGLLLTNLISKMLKH
jgi:two-component system CheB/CheR fusion protein